MSEDPGWQTSWMCPDCRNANLLRIRERNLNHGIPFLRNRLCSNCRGRFRVRISGDGRLAEEEQTFWERTSRKEPTSKPATRGGFV